MNRLLIVRMSALGDIVHALPVLAALRAAHPELEVDWLVDRRYAAVLRHVDGLSRCIEGRPGLTRAVTALRARRYDAAIDLQGLLKSAVMTRLSGARRVIGFERRALREPAAAWCYGERASVRSDVHVIRKNLSVLPLLGVHEPEAIRFPFVVPASPVADAMTCDAASGAGFAIINPGAAWPNKRWPPERFGAVARHVRDRHGLACYVVWGGDEGTIADRVVAASAGAAVRAPETTIGDLLAMASRAALMISGDTGPVHLAAAVGTPIVGLYGPTWPARNGPWRADDVVVSRADTCECHHKRQCQRPAERMCIGEITIDKVCAAVDRRMARAAERHA